MIHINKTSVTDSHVHLWDIDRLVYPWLKDEPTINRSFLIDDYNNNCNKSSELQIEKIVFVQCECSTDMYMDEIDLINEIAHQDNRLKAIIPWAPLENGEEVIPDLDKMAENKLIKGIRRIIEFESDIDFCLRPDFIKGIQFLSDYGLSFDINIDHTQLENTIKMVKLCPDVWFMLDHAGKPDIKNNILDPWKKQIRELSHMPNVYCKISHLVNKASNNGMWKADDLIPYVYHCIDCFGIDRVVYASDWPVCTLASDIPTWFNTINNILRDFTVVEREKFFSKNADTFYRI